MVFQTARLDICRPHAAELIASGDRKWKISGWCIFVVCCVGFVATGVYLVYKSVHRKASRKACYALLTVEEEVRRAVRTAVTLSCSTLTADKQHARSCRTPIEHVHDDGCPAPGVAK